MDNASKALIIAGAILIAVMLVSLGVMLYNTAANVAENSVGSVDALGIQGFNAQFESYFGTKSRAQAQGLVNKVRANNATDNPYINWSGDAEGQLAGAKNNERFTIRGYYDDSTGYLDSISITKN
jgi:hypothetical protein